MIKLDIGCGKKKKEGFIGIDCIAFPGVDHVLNVADERWPFDDNSVDEVYASHIIEHLTARERVAFVNELYRVLKPGAKCTLIAPHWASCRAYGDPTHQWPAISEWWFYYLDKKWRAEEAPATDVEWNPSGFSCDFESTWGYAMHGHLATRSDEYRQHALQFYREAAQDIHATLTKRAAE